MTNFMYFLLCVQMKQKQELETSEIFTRTLERLLRKIQKKGLYKTNPSATTRKTILVILKTKWTKIYYFYGKLIQADSRLKYQSEKMSNNTNIEAGKQSLDESLKRIACCKEYSSVQNKKTHKMLCLKGNILKSCVYDWFKKRNPSVFWFAGEKWYSLVRG